MSDCMFLRRGMQKKKTVTATFNPSSYTVQSSNPDSVVTNASNMYKPYTNTSDYASWFVPTVASNYSFLLLGFDLSSIPNNAEIISVSLMLRATKNNVSGWYAAAANAGSNGNTKYSNQNLGNSSATYLTFSGATWTREELVNGMFYIGASRSASNTDPHYVFIFGATLTVEYAYYE